MPRASRQAEYLTSGDDRIAGRPVIVAVIAALHIAVIGIVNKVGGLANRPAITHAHRFHTRTVPVGLIDQRKRERTIAKQRLRQRCVKSAFRSAALRTAVALCGRVIDKVLKRIISRGGVAITSHGKAGARLQKALLKRTRYDCPCSLLVDEAVSLVFTSAHD